MNLDRVAKMNLPSLLTNTDWRIRREEILDCLRREEYGYSPEAPESVSGVVESSETAFGGKAMESVIRISFDTPKGEFSFPMRLIAPVGVHAPVFLNIAFRPDVPDRYLPAEEIIDHGYAIALVYYKDVTDDNAVWDGIADMYPRDEKTGWGKIGMWAFAASRMMDYLLTRDDVDAGRVCVIGHSRLGKTALWCAAQDERFAMAVSNDSGCSGAAISRGKVGESVRDICERFPFWFCGNFQNWMDREAEMPFDQHFLLGLIAPRKLYVCSATEDEWADPASEFLGCVLADEAWRNLGVTGLVAPDGMPKPESPLMEGNIGYHLRTGEHFLGRTDWLYFMDYRDRHGV